MPPTRPLLLLAATALVLGPLAGVPTSSAAPSTGSGATGAGACAEPLFATEVRASTVRRTAPARFAAAAGRNGAAEDDVRRAAASDPSLWLDVCGRAFYRDAPLTEHAGDHAAEGGAESVVPAGTDVFALASRPGATRTIHLDFRGRRIADTAWNESGPFTAPPFTMDDDPTTFSATERTQVHEAWETVAEDYAPFDVNVTTADVPEAAITRSSDSDQVFGTRVVVSDAPEVSDGCGCGGVAYVGVFSATRNHAAYQPAWVFASGPGSDGFDIGEVASHEAGHNFGLDHDGDAGSGYHGGSGNWAPIMGASWGRALTQWSRGEYAGATKREDDLAIIASGARWAADDHADTTQYATPLASGGTRAGLVGSPADVDAFGFDGTGATTVAVRTAAESADLDVRLTVLAADGSVVAKVDPQAPGRVRPHPSPDWLGATWTGTLPATGGPWTAVVDGVGAGDPAASGGYSDYGSLGRYTVSLTTQPVPPETDPTPEPDPDPDPEPDPGTDPEVEVPPAPATLVFRTRPALPQARVGRGYRTGVLLAGPPSVRVSRSSGALPRGLRMTRGSSGVVLSGTPRRPGLARFTLRATSPDGQVATRVFTLRVRR